jgi:DNA replicative helicase MCM subunit Mcm2 (Cdc46/Mcm family)
MSEKLQRIWLNYWRQYFRNNESSLKRVAQEYPVRRGLKVSYSDLVELGIPHRMFRYNPDRVLNRGISAFDDFVDEAEIRGSWERGYNALVPHVVDLPEGFKAHRISYLADHLGELVQLRGTISSATESKADLMEAAFLCPDGHVTRVHQASRHKQTIDTCGESNCQQSVYLEPRESLFCRVQRIYVSGQGFDDTMVILGGITSRYDNISIGDEFIINGIPRAEYSGQMTHGDVFLDGLYIQPVQAKHNA